MPHLVIRALHRPIAVPDQSWIEGQALFFQSDALAGEPILRTEESRRTEECGNPAIVETVPLVAYTPSPGKACPHAAYLLAGDSFARAYALQSHYHR
jgi:hypothetical protein